MNILNDEDPTGKIMFSPIMITTIVMNCLIILIVIYLVFLYIKSKELHSFSSAYILILSIAILIDNVLRIIPVGEKINKASKYTQALFLTSLDKYILLALTSQVFIIYLGIMKTNFYYNHKKKIFFITFFSGLGVSFLIGGLFLINGTNFYGIYHYAADTNARKIFDNIFNSVFLFLNTFFCIIIIINICLRKEEIEKEMASEDYSEHDLKRIILIFIANSIIYVESFLIIHDKMPVDDDYIDLVYIITCLLINLIYAINKIVIRETKRIFCKKLFQKKIPTNTNADRYTYNNSEMTNKTSEDYFED